MLFFFTAKSDVDDEEGTISRPGSPKDDPDGEKTEAVEDTAGTTQQREKSATSARVGKVCF